MNNACACLPHLLSLRWLHAADLPHQASTGQRQHVVNAEGQHRQDLKLRIILGLPNPSHDQAGQLERRQHSPQVAGAAPRRGQWLLLLLWTLGCTGAGPQAGDNWFIA